MDAMSGRRPVTFARYKPAPVDATITEATWASVARVLGLPVSGPR